MKEKGELFEKHSFCLYEDKKDLGTGESCLFSLRGENNRIVGEKKREVSLSVVLFSLFFFLVVDFFRD